MIKPSQVFYFAYTNNSKAQRHCSKDRLPIDQTAELDRLQYAVEAPFNSCTKQQEPICLPNTRVSLLREIYDWADGHDKCCIFWLNSLAGTRKSTIARTVARNYFKRKHLRASFFFSRGVDMSAL